jgi:6-pyruvoyltetrahydropterin/6-carboxytetrahydropterin synthase
VGYGVRLGGGVFRVSVRDRVMIAHSFRGEVFGPAQQLHGATYLVEAEFAARKLDPDGLVVDIGLAHQELAKAIAPLAYRNLDDLPELAGINTTTEFLAGWLWRQIHARIRAGALGRTDLDRLRITLRESDVAWASFDESVE